MICCEVRKKGLNLGFPHLKGMPLAVIKNKALDPEDIRFFRMVTQVASRTEIGPHKQ